MCIRDRYMGNKYKPNKGRKGEHYIQSMLGAHGAPKPADAKSQEIANNVKTAVEGQLNQTFATYNVVHYTTQVVAGTNYKIKLDVGGGQHIHIAVFQPLPHTGGAPELKSAEGGKTLEDTLQVLFTDQITQQIHTVHLSFPVDPKDFLQICASCFFKYC
eukprot:TRINITY_DN1148_c0_g1_i1.p2 TRINITY_DN1148_c0_g1~~TRINITY_DN1148_c0_g1_i1.p2  ORF type:complete len:159 (+),score=45.63 TRINITY_DN1148_c0_g1_i1:92-568(+)